MKFSIFNFQFSKNIKGRNAFVPFVSFGSSVSLGFTLIELVIAIAVLAILAALAIATLDPFSQIQKSNDAKRKSDLSQIQKALEQYYQDNNQYPPSSNDNTFRITYQNNPIDWGKGPWGPYMDVLPKDPTSGRTYVYYSPAPYQSYYLDASLERGGLDAQACQETVASCHSSPYSNNCTCNNTPKVNGVTVTCGGVNTYCNFGVSSPNVSP